MTDRRATLEAAFDEAEKDTPETTDTPVVVAKEDPVPVTLEKTDPLAEKPAEEKPAPAESATPAAKAPEPDESKPAEKVYAVEKAPQSWRPAQKEKWEKLDPEVRQEVIRRERETEQALSSSAQARKIAQEFQQSVQPYMARVEAMGISPIAAAQQLFRADHILTTAPKAQRAEFMAKIIKDYDVDVVELDRALSGAPPADPVQATVDKLLQERLAPFMSLVERQQQAEATQAQRAAQTMEQQIAEMENNPKFPEFDEVRGDMADLIEIQSKRGIYLTLEQAYSRAIAMNPDVSARVTQRHQAASSQAAAQEANSRAQRALKASSSVSGSPSGTPAGGISALDRRATIAAAFDSIEGR
jgi:tetratricopeptide (TPR) repeat protein